MLTKIPNILIDKEAYSREYEKNRQDSAKSLLKSAIEVWLTRGGWNSGWVGENESLHAAVITNTGLMGGNQSHGAVLSITFWVEGGANHIDFKPSPSDDRIFPYGGGDGAQVTLTARGDWEQQGLTDTLAHLLLKILSGETGHLA